MMHAHYHACIGSWRGYFPWICTIGALGYAAYLHFKIRKLNHFRLNKDKDLPKSNSVNIDQIDRNVPKNRIAYCRCWKSKTFPLCDGTHKCHNEANDDLTGPLVLVWNDGPTTQPTAAAGAADAQSGPQPSNASHDDQSGDAGKDMDIKSIDSEPQQSSDSNGEFDNIVKINNDAASSNVEELSSLEMIDEDQLIDSKLQQQ